MFGCVKERMKSTFCVILRELYMVEGIIELILQKLDCKVVTNNSNSSFTANI